MHLYRCLLIHPIFLMSVPHYFNQSVLRLKAITLNVRLHHISWRSCLLSRLLLGHIFDYVSFEFIADVIFVWETITYCNLSMCLYLGIYTFISWEPCINTDNVSFHLFHLVQNRSVLIVLANIALESHICLILHIMLSTTVSCWHYSAINALLIEVMQHIISYWTISVVDCHRTLWLGLLLVHHLKFENAYIIEDILHNYFRLYLYNSISFKCFPYDFRIIWLKLCACCLILSTLWIYTLPRLRHNYILVLQLLTLFQVGCIDEQACFPYWKLILICVQR